jgi:ElaB/YqjD/DUF883 family membrane-anchored ribosome-binding protein
MKNSATAATTDELVSDVQDALSGAESMLEQATTATTERAAELRRLASQQLRLMREKLQESSGKALERTKEAARVTDDYVHDNPWRVIVGAVAIGVVLGLLVNRGR